MHSEEQITKVADVIEQVIMDVAAADTRSLAEALTVAALDAIDNNPDAVENGKDRIQLPNV